MKRPLLRGLLGQRRSSAILEFATVFPILLALIGGVGDFGLYLWSRGRLVDAVAYGAQYAFLLGNSNGANTYIGNAVSKVASAALAGVAVSVNGPACYCLTGSNPPSMTASNCTSLCASGALPGHFVTIQPSYSYQPVFPVISSYLPTTIYEHITARVQ
jgi:Flp pilus assembly protein TadG